MRLVIVSNDYPPDPGGIQQYLGNLVARYPHPVRVLAPRLRREEVSSTEDVVVRSRWSFMWPTAAVGDWIASAATDFDPDVVVFGAPHPLPALGRRLRDRLGIPYGVITHGAEITVPAAFPGTRQLVAAPLRWADVVFTNSRFTTAKVERLTGRPATYLGIGVDTDEFSPAPAVIDGPRRLVVGSVSRFVPRKRQADVIRAAAELRRLGHDLELLIVGRGRLEGRLRRLATRLAVPARFEVAVPWERLAGLYRQMDLFAMPCRSRWFGLEAEGLGIVFLEASASGLAVVAGDSGGAPETVMPGVTGYVAYRRSDVTEALGVLATDGDRRRRMGAAGRERMLAEFGWDGVMERFAAGLKSASLTNDRRR